MSPSPLPFNPDPLASLVTEAAVRVADHVRWAWRKLQARKVRQ